ncbi:MAG: hypothetical protein KatS3mg123_0645 [Burkholderiales bacterium]|nr:MAG: hypothetical protein KatS3mg123_0645 [Burkholderiales bacterium]
MNTRKPDPAGLVEADRPQRAVSICRGSLYLPREMYDLYFAGAQTVALVAREDKILVIPLVPGSAGGLLVKTRNARGDRVVHAQEFFRENGFAEDFQQHVVLAQWSPEAAALVLSNLAKSQGV